MSLNGEQFTTQLGQEKLASALLGNGPKVQIKHVALGDGNGSLYQPFEAQNELRRELARTEITRQHMSGDRTWRVVAEFGTDIDAFWMREVGFFDVEGDLIFIVAGTEFNEGYTGAFDLLFEGFLNLTGVADGLVVVTAPDDEVFAVALASAASQVATSAMLIRQGDAIRKIQREGQSS